MTSTIINQDLPDLANMSAHSLYVGDLLPHITEVVLYKKFAAMGTVTSVKLCRDWGTGKSLCYAYVNFDNSAEAEKAYRTLNHELLEGQPMRILKSTRSPFPPPPREITCNQNERHCCGNAGGNSLVDAKTLVEAIEIMKQTLAMQETNESKGPTGYKYSSDFLKRMNNTNKFTNVFIKNFKDLLDDYKLERLCRQFGEVVSVKVMVDEYGISKGFGFACFTDSDAAQRAVNKLNGLVLDGRTLYAGPAMTGTQRHRGTSFRSDQDDYRPANEYRPSAAAVSSRICVRNLRDLVDDTRLYKEFQRFGPVLHAEVLKSSDGRSRGSGYVDFKDKADAARALNCMNGKAFYGTRIAVTYVPHTNTVSTNTTMDDVSDHLHHHGNQRHSDSNKYRHSSNDNDDDNLYGGEEFTYNIENLDKNKMSSYKSRSDDARKGSKNSFSSTGNDGDSNRSFLQLKNLASSLAGTDNRHPINIKDIDNFSNVNVIRTNRNSSNNTDINTSNNAIRGSAAGYRSSNSSGRGGDGEREAAGCDGSSMGGASRAIVGAAACYDVVEDDYSSKDGDQADDLCSNTSATLCVKNLDESITDEKLENLFNVFGAVLSASVISSEHGDSKGFGFVIMSEPVDAVKAIKHLDGRIVVNRPIYVTPAAQPRPLAKV